MKRCVLICYYQTLLIFIALKFWSGPGSVGGIATGYGLDGPGIETRWGRNFPHLSRPALWHHPASCTMDTGSFAGVKSGRGVTLTPHPLLVAWSRKSRAIPLLPLWAVWPVQSLSTCTGVQVLYKGDLYLFFNVLKYFMPLTCFLNTFGS